jgi:hypothetical protein
MPTARLIAVTDTETTDEFHTERRKRGSSRIRRYWSSVQFSESHLSGKVKNSWMGLKLVSSIHR